MASDAKTFFRFRCRAIVSAAPPLLAAGLALACVGSEKNEGQDTRVIARDSVPPAVTYRDTVSPADYRIFQSVEATGHPKKMVYRLFVLQPASPDALSKTLRVALDSIAQADSSLAAARAVLYTFRRTGPSEGRLLPRVWGEWVPTEGWDRAPPRSAQGVYRSYIYRTNPGWSATERRTAAAADGGVEGR